MNKLPPVLVAKAELGGRSLLELEVDPLYPVIHPSADACCREVIRVCRFTGLLLRLGGRTRPVSRRGRGLRARAQPLTKRQPGLLFPVDNRLDHTEVCIAPEPTAIALFLGREEEPAGIGAADLPAADGGGLERSEQPLAGPGGGGRFGLDRVEAVDGEGNRNPTIDEVRQSASL